MRNPGWTWVGALALGIAALHLGWLPAGMQGDGWLVANQVLIGLAWVAIGIASMRR